MILYGPENYYYEIKIFIFANTKKSAKEAIFDFLQIHKKFNQRDAQRYHKSFVLLHRKYISERDQEEMWII